MLLPWSSQSMGQGMSLEGLTLLQSHKEKWGVREGFLLATRSGLPTVPRPLVCVCWGVCVKRASPLLLCTAEMRGFTALPGRRRRSGLPPLTDKGLVLRVCPRLLLTVSGCWCGSAEGVRPVSSHCGQQLLPLPPAFTADNCPILSFSTDFIQTLGKGKGFIYWPLLKPSIEKTKPNICFLSKGCN